MIQVDALWDRLWRYVQPDNETDCWVWCGATGSRGGGYARTNVEGKPLAVHRLTYTLIGGSQIPSRYVVDHLCRNTLCVNPTHLEAVTNRENLIRGARRQYRCGHDPDQFVRSEKTTKTGRSFLSTRCLQCNREATRRWRLRGGVK